jgi:hypothetical protein
MPAGRSSQVTQVRWPLQAAGLLCGQNPEDSHTLPAPMREICVTEQTPHPTYWRELDAAMQISDNCDLWCACKTLCAHTYKERIIIIRYSSWRSTSIIGGSVPGDNRYINIEYTTTEPRKNGEPRAGGADPGGGALPCALRAEAKGARARRAPGSAYTRSHVLSSMSPRRPVGSLCAAHL